MQFESLFHKQIKYKINTSTWLYLRIWKNCLNSKEDASNLILVNL